MQKIPGRFLSFGFRALFPIAPFARPEPGCKRCVGGQRHPVKAIHQAKRKKEAVCTMRARQSFRLRGDLKVGSQDDQGIPILSCPRSRWVKLPEFQTRLVSFNTLCSQTVILAAGACFSSSRVRFSFRLFALSSLHLVNTHMTVQPSVASFFPSSFLLFILVACHHHIKAEALSREMRAKYDKHGGLVAPADQATNA